jgi:hypothetical protein
MMFPRDRAVYANLSTSFTDYDALIADLEARKVTGYLRLAFPAYEGILFLIEGAAVNALEQGEQGKLTGPAAARSIAERVKDKGGALWVYQLTPELVNLLVSVLDGEVLFRELSTAFTSLDKLVAKMRAEGLSGYIEVILSGELGIGMIFLKDGEPVEALLTSETQTLSGRTAVETIVQSAGTAGGSFNVVRAGGPKVAPVAPGAMRSQASSNEILAVWEAVIRGVETVVDRFAKKDGRFLLAFKEVLVARAGTYPFLDPFAGDFEYRGGKLRLDGPVPEDLSQGLGDCLADAIAKLAFQLRRADLETRIREELSGLAEKHSEVIARLELGPALQEFVA